MCGCVTVTVADVAVFAPGAVTWIRYCPDCDGVSIVNDALPFVVSVLAGIVTVTGFVVGVVAVLNVTIFDRAPVPLVSIALNVTARLLFSRPQLYPPPHSRYTYGLSTADA